ncbi:MAG: carboxypeptidase-like regulatory domain-containing protein [Nonlabens sp.]|uniref:carboxypeptidase-like regulatory domain-containing protein n=1 Tax=Nonlabens sp. TaxID=1888209 RepID=UPI00321B7457
MKNILIVLFLVAGWANAQKERVQIQGTLNSETNEPLQGVTVFNNAALEGTVTNKEGNFFIYARVGDKLTFQAVQFEPFSLSVNEKVMKDKKVSISLSEAVNQLDEVVIDDDMMKIKVKKITYVDTKVDEVSEFNKNTIAVDRMENTFSDRVRQPEEYQIRNEAFNQNMPRFNMANILGGLAMMALGATISELTSGVNNVIDDGPDSLKSEFDVYMLKNKYSTNYLLDYLKIPQEDLFEFLYFAKDKGLNESMFEPENELDLLQFLSNQVNLYKTKKNYSKKTEDFSPSTKVKSNEK